LWQQYNLDELELVGLVDLPKQPLVYMCTAEYDVMKCAVYCMNVSSSDFNV